MSTSVKATYIYTQKENMLGLRIVGINNLCSICISKVTFVLTISIFKPHLHRVSFDVLHCYRLTASHV